MKYTHRQELNSSGSTHEGKSQHLAALHDGHGKQGAQQVQLHKHREAATIAARTLGLPSRFRKPPLVRPAAENRSV